MPAPAIFAPLPLRSVTLPNRVMLSPMCQYMAADGLPNDWHLVHLGRYAAGALGVIMTEATAVTPAGRISPHCLGLWNDAQTDAFKQVIQYIKKTCQTPVAIQLAHAGRKASTAAPWAGGRPLIQAPGWPCDAPSAVPYDAGWPTPLALDDAGLRIVRDAFVAAAKRADAAGFDIIELHAAHGYLMHQFLSPIANQRTDGYGGSRDARMRFPLEVAEALRRAWPADKPLFVRMTGSDWVGDAGWQIDDAIAFANALKGLGVDLLDVSSGGMSPKQKIAVGPGYQVHFAAAVRRATGLPTAAVGLITTPQQAESILAAGDADVIALGRALLHDPFWAWRAADALGGTVTIPNSYLRGRHVGTDTPRNIPAPPPR